MHISLSKDKLLNLTFSSKISKNLMANVHFDFMGRNKLWLTTTGVIIVICIAFLATRGLSQSIDFTGGRNFKVQFENKVSRNKFESLFPVSSVMPMSALSPSARTARQYVSVPTTVSKKKVTTSTLRLKHTYTKH